MRQSKRNEQTLARQRKIILRLVAQLVLPTVSLSSSLTVPQLPPTTTPVQEASSVEARSLVALALNIHH